MPKPYYQTALRLAVICGLALVMSDWILRQYPALKRWGSGTLVRHDYTLALYSFDGRRLSADEGELSLRLAPFVSYENVPNQNRSYLHTDPDGFRLSRPECRNDAAQIVLFGGSTAFGSGVASEQGTLAAILGEGVGSCILNAAVNGYQSGHEISTLVHKLMDRKFQLMFTLNGWNDAIMSFQAERDLPDHNEAQLSAQLERMSRREYSLMPARAVYGLLDTFVPYLSRRFDGAAQARLSPDELLPRVVDRYVRNMTRMKQLAGDAGANFFVMLQPDLNVLKLKAGLRAADPDEEKPALFYNDFRRKAREEFEHRGILCVDSADFSELLLPEYFTDAIHLTEAGYVALSGILSDFIRQHELLKKPSSASVR